MVHSPATTGASQTFDADPIQALWAEIRANLTRTKDEIYAQIRAYPPPIPACDVQFNFLLEERAKIFQELGQVGTLAQASRQNPEARRLLEEFLHSSRYVDANVKQQIWSTLSATPAAAIP